MELPAKLGADAIDHLGAHHRFADRRFLAPLRSVLEEVEDGDGKVMVGRQQSLASGDDAVGESCLAPAVVRENRVGNDRGWGIFIPLRNHDFHPVCRQHPQRAGKSRHRECMRVHAEKQRAIDLLLLPVQANGLTDGGASLKAFGGATVS